MFVLDYNFSTFIQTNQPRCTSLLQHALLATSWQWTLGTCWHRVKQRKADGGPIRVVGVMQGTRVGTLKIHAIDFLYIFLCAAEINMAHHDSAKVSFMCTCV